MYIYLIIHSFWCFCEKEIVSNKYVDHTNNFLILFKKKKQQAQQHQSLLVTPTVPTVQL